jgi:hypothetical protein
MPTALEIAKWLFGGRSDMFGRYTEHARRTIFFGRWEALHTGSQFIEPDHIALGMLRDSWLTDEILKEFSADEVRKEIVAKLPEATPASNETDIPLSPASKRVLRFAAAAADSLFDSHIGDEHLLLGLLQAGRQSSRPAFSLLISTALNSRDIRTRIKKIPREARKKHGEAQAAKWREAGIPDGYTISDLLYNAAAEMLVLELKGIKTEFSPKRLFTRHRAAERYERVGNPDEDISFESPATCEKQPIVVFNAIRFSKTSSGNFGGADWEGMYFLDLGSKEIHMCVSKDNFVLPRPYDERGWVSSVRGVSDDGAHAYVIVALGTRKSESEIVYDYHMAKVELKSGVLELISHLKNTFF